MRTVIHTLAAIVFAFSSAVVAVVNVQSAHQESVVISESADHQNTPPIISHGAQLVEINAIDSGWYSDTGYHEPTNLNYLVGQCALPQCSQPVVFRNFFVFDLSGITGQILTATLMIENPQYVSGDPSETWTTFDVTTPIPTLVAGGTGLMSIYNDLGNGTIYGSTVVTLNTTLVKVPLDADAISALNAAVGNQFAIGGALTTLDGLVNREWVFGNSNATYVRKLVLSVVSPLLTINYSSGQPGSFFTLTGSGFPPNDTATIAVNGVVLTSTLAVDGSGEFVFLLDTGQADNGYYAVTAMVNPSAMTSFILDPNSPLRLQEGSGPIFSVPSGIAWKAIYLPLILR